MVEFKVQKKWKILLPSSCFCSYMIVFWKNTVEKKCPMLSPPPMARSPSLSHGGAPGVQDTPSLRWVPLRDTGCDATGDGRGQGEVTAQNSGRRQEIPS